MRARSVRTDVLVIGSGAAGLCAAIKAAPRAVLLLAPELQAASCTELASGGIAAPVSAADSVALHVADTLRAAAHSGNAAVSRRIIAGAAGAVAFLEHCGVRFDRDSIGGAGEGAPHLHLEAGHALPRVLHADGDATGAAIHAALLTQALRSTHIRFLNAQAVRLLSGARGIGGAQAVRSDGAALVIHANETVLATGGLGQLFAHTTNSRYATGDGLAMALERGAEVAGLEFVQFHPTALCCARDPLPLLTEALRGAGATLIDERGERFMLAADERAELAPRDVVARALWQHQQAGHATWLDARAVFSGSEAQGYPSARAACLREGLDPARALIPVTPAAHFHMGGVRTDERGRSSLPGLWACGEVACTGLHGANRLASNSLLEAVVMGCAVGRSLARGRRVTRAAIARSPLTTAALQIDAARWRRLRRLMWECMGPVRSGAGQRAALMRIHALLAGAPPGEVCLRLRLRLCVAMLQAALAREESRGAHWRSDFPVRDRRRDGWRALAEPGAHPSA